jgi:Heparinase II/III-like protein/Heparinase II/III N-terminus
MSRLTVAYHAARELGPVPLGRWILYQSKLRSGWIRAQTPVASWEEPLLARALREDFSAKPEDYAAYRKRLAAPRFFFDPFSDLSGALGDAAQAVAEADDLRDGWFRLFGLPAVWLGTPPDWSALAPLSDNAPPPSVDLTEHWTETRIEQVPGDIKLLWELSRFGWVFPMVRAYRATGNRAYAEACWDLILSWRLANKPNAGAHWVSAQEVALRLMALTFAFYGLAPWFHRKATRITRLASMILAHAARIPATLDYAHAQHNNHLLVEGVGLYTAGVLFPEMAEADAWRRSGRKALLHALRTQVFADGGYIQHSANYHRLALQAATWAASLAQLNDEPLPTQALDSVRRLARALHALVDPKDGRAPNFGPNDGALILPLSDGDFDDHRPALQAAFRLLDERDAFRPGPWDEACLWLGIGGGHKADAGEGAAITSLPDAGLHLVSAGEARGLLRCAHFTSRPGHSDQLHFDLRVGGQPLALDAGTYLYNGAPPWDNSLMYAAAHNTLVVDHQEPMLRSGPFLWLDWAQGRVLGRWRSPDGRMQAISAEQEGFHRFGILHRRTVLQASPALWLVVDDVLGSGEHTARLGWLLADGKWSLRPGKLGIRYERLRLEVWFAAPNASPALYRAGELLAGHPADREEPTKGWVAWTYADRQPALRLELDSTGPLPLRLITWLAIDDAATGAVELAWREPGHGITPFVRAALGASVLDLDRAHPDHPSSVRRAG